MKKIFNKKLATLFLSCCAGVMFISCSDDNGGGLSEIRIGRETPLRSVSINKQTTRSILLSGGNGKYKAYVADPTVATVTVSGDTLKLSGVWEGETYVTVHSHDYTARLDVRVVPNTLSFSQDSIRLYPKEESAFVTLTGGGLVKLEKEDPDNILTVKWNADNHVVELRPQYEGDVRLTAIGQDGTRKTLHIKVRCEGEIEQVGYYSTTSRNIYSALNTRLIVARRQTGISMFNGSNPKTSKGIRISPVVNPEPGTIIDVRIKLFGDWENATIRTGVLKLFVEEIRPDHTVLLRGLGHKFLVPYY